MSITGSRHNIIINSNDRGRRRYPEIRGEIRRSKEERKKEYYGKKRRTYRRDERKRTM